VPDETVGADKCGVERKGNDEAAEASAGDEVVGQRVSSPGSFTSMVHQQQQVHGNQNQSKPEHPTNGLAATTVVNPVRLHQRPDRPSLLELCEGIPATVVEISDRMTAVVI
jgi:hypothetical protein